MDNLQTPESPQPNPLAEQFSRVVKQEKYVAEERKKIEEAKKAFEADKFEVEMYRSLKGKNPFEILKHFDIGYDQLLAADKERASPVDPTTKRALEIAESSRAEVRQLKEDAERNRLSRAEIELKSMIDGAIKTHEFDLIEKLGEQDSVRDYMDEMYRQTKEIPDVKEACEAVTDFLIAKFEAVKDSKWLKPKAPVEEPRADPVPKSAAILSNKMTQSTVGKDRPMSDHERMKAAIAAMDAVKSR